VAWDPLYWKPANAGLWPKSWTGPESFRHELSDAAANTNIAAFNQGLFKEIIFIFILFSFQSIIVCRFKFY
jgi:hypothetical protein